MQPFDRPVSARSLVECVGADCSKCGYCGRQQSSHNYGMWAHRLDVHDYQNLLDAGWRRSGTYLYRPNLISTCCPAFVIRLDASRFKPSSTQKRVLKRLRRFSKPDRPVDVSVPHLIGSSILATHSPNPTVVHDVRISANQTPLRRACAHVSDAIHVALRSILEHDADSKSFLSHTLLDNAVEKIKVYPARQHSAKNPHSKHLNSRTASNTLHLTSNVALVLAAAERQHLPAPVAAAVSSISTSSKQTTNIQLDDSQSNSGKRRKPEANQVQRQMVLASLIMKHIQSSNDPSHPDVVFDKVTVTHPGFLNFWLPAHQAHQDEHMPSTPLPAADVKAESVRAQFFPHRSDSHSIGKKLFGDIMVNNSDSDRSDLSSTGTHVMQSAVLSPLDSSSSATTSVPPSSHNKIHNQAILDELAEGDVFTMELIPARFEREAYEIFRKYQMGVHRELPHQCSELSYRRFLIDSPLVHTSSNGDSECGYGSFHMLYRLSGKLFAVGVVDVLPRCLSSVYLFYDPEFAKLSPGVLSAVKEIEWVRRVADATPSLRFYYMGYYIHSCPKMRYKAAYHPSEILCEETKNWIPAADVKAILDSSNGRTLRLAPHDMEDAIEASNFNLSLNEVETLTNESRFRITFSQDDDHIVSLRTLDTYLSVRYPEHLEGMKMKIREFVRLVGKASCRFFVHLFYLE